MKWKHAAPPSNTACHPFDCVCTMCEQWCWTYKLMTLLKSIVIAFLRQKLFQEPHELVSIAQRIKEWKWKVKEKFVWRTLQTARACVCVHIKSSLLTYFCFRNLRYWIYHSRAVQHSESNRRKFKYLFDMINALNNSVCAVSGAKSINVNTARLKSLFEHNRLNCCRQQQCSEWKNFLKEKKNSKHHFKRDIDWTNKKKNSHKPNRALSLCICFVWPLFMFSCKLCSIGYLSQLSSRSFIYNWFMRILRRYF